MCSLNNRRLREVNFGDCLVKTNGAYHLGEALETSNEQLESIDLSFNEINSDGGLVLVGAMKNKPKLRYLNLDGNCFRSEGCNQIIAEMSKLPNPKALQPFEEDNSTDEEQDDDEDEEGEGEGGELEEDYDDEEEETDDHEHGNDTTEEADENEEDYAEETAYVTSSAFTTKVGLSIY